MKIFLVIVIVLVIVTKISLAWISRDHQLVLRTTNRHDWTRPCCMVVMNPDWQSYTGVTDVVSQICCQCTVTTTSFRVGSWEHGFVNHISSLWRKMAAGLAKSAEPHELSQWQNRET